MLLMLIGLSPVFVKVAVLGPPALPMPTLAQLIEVGDTVAVDPEVVPLEVTPMPESAICCGLLPELSAKFRLAVLAPEVVGLNKTVTVQVAKEGSAEPHVFLSIEKSPESLPSRLTPLITSGPPPVFVSVAVLGVPA